MFSDLRKGAAVEGFYDRGEKGSNANERSRERSSLRSTLHSRLKNGVLHDAVDAYGSCEDDARVKFSY